MKTHQVDQQEKERLKPLLMEFAEKCISPRAWNDIIGIGISTVGLIDQRATEKNRVCFVVYLKRLPKLCPRPEEYRGIRVCWVVKAPKE